jgi:hypothetical protein
MLTTVMKNLLLKKLEVELVKLEWVYALDVSRKHI